MINACNGLLVCTAKKAASGSSTRTAWECLRNSLQDGLKQGHQAAGVEATAQLLVLV